MRREEFDVLVKFPAVDLVLDLVVGEMHLVVKLRQVVIARQAADRGRRGRADRTRATIRRRDRAYRVPLNHSIGVGHRSSLR